MKRLIVSCPLILSCVLLTGCTYWTDFVLVNKSDKTLTVQYVLAGIEANVLAFPTLGIATIEQFEKHNSFDRIPDDRLVIDTEKKEYTVEVNSNEVLFLTRIDARDVYDAPVYKSGITCLSIQNDSGAVVYSGDQVFKQFAPGLSRPFVSVPAVYKITYPQ